MLDVAGAREQIGIVRQRTTRPLNTNFFCHRIPGPDPDGDIRWRARLAAYHVELGLDSAGPNPAAGRAPFDDAMCEVVEDLTPEVVSFHFGLPEESLLRRVKAAGCAVLSSATTVEEARWLEGHGCDAIVAQGYEAGAQIGTAYLFTAESRISELHRTALHSAPDHRTALTNIFTGRPTRGLVNRIMDEIGPMSDDAPAFPTADRVLAPLRRKAEAAGVADFSPLWAGQAVGLGRELGAAELTRELAASAQRVLRSLVPGH